MRRDQDLDRLADEWVESVLGDDLDPEVWPRPDEGRTGREVSLFVVPEPSEALGGLLFASWPAAENSPGRPLCSHCGLEPRKVQWSRKYGVRDVGNRCYTFALRNGGRLPDRRLNWLYAHRAA